MNQQTVTVTVTDADRSEIEQPWTDNTLRSRRQLAGPRGYATGRQGRSGAATAPDIWGEPSPTDTSAAGIDEDDMVEVATPRCDPGLARRASPTSQAAAAQAHGRPHPPPRTLTAR
jgi:hypothetical protein